MSWISGMILDVESFVKTEASVVRDDLAPMWANIKTEFMDAEGKFAADVYGAFKGVIAGIWATESAAHPGDLMGAISATFKASLPALESGGIRIAESALIQFISSLLMAA